MSGLDNKYKGSVLILGAGLMQKPAICAAKELNLKSFVIDANEKALCVPDADVFKKIDLKNKEQIYEYAKILKETENLCGIFTCGTDFSASVSYAAEKLSFHAHKYENALNASIKPRMRACFDEGKVPSPRFYSVQNDYDMALDCVNKIGFPCVVKPADNMGARGCRLIRNPDECNRAVNDAFNNSRTRTIILEEYMEGPEFSIDALVYNGTLTITGFADRHIFYPPYFIETGHTMPSVFDKEKQKELITVFAQGIKALGLTEGAAKADIKYTENGPEIGEIAARLSGGYMSGWTFPYSSDFNLVKEAMKISCGIKPDELLERRIPLEYKFPEKSKNFEKPFELFEIPSVHVSAERAYISIPGKIKSIERIGEEVPSEIKNVFPRDFKAGDEVDFPRNNVSKCGNAVSLSDNYEKAVSASEKEAGSVLIRLDKNNPETENFLADKELPDEKGFPPASFSAYEKLKETEISGIVEENESVLKNVPVEIKTALDSVEKNWNYRTLSEEAELFDLITKKHRPVSKNRFWKAILKGGIQAALYVIDCEN